MQPSPTLDCPRMKIMTVGNSGVGKSCLVKRYCEGRFVSKYIPTIGIDYGVKLVEVKPALYVQYKTKVRQTGTGGAGVTAGAGTSSLPSPPTAVRVNFWDVAGASVYAEVRNEFYTAAQGILLVYDVNDATSLEALEVVWWNEIKSYLPQVEGVDSPGETARRVSATRNTPAGQAVGDTRGAPPVLLLCANKADDSAKGRRVVSEAEGQSWAARHGCVAYIETSASTGHNVAEAFEGMFYEVMARFM